MKNKKLMLAIADMIEKKPDESVDMGTVMNDCGSAGCILGWGVHDGIIEGYNLYNREGYFQKNGSKNLFDFEDLAVKLFNIPSSTAYTLFTQSDQVGNSPKDLAYRLRRFVESAGADLCDIQGYFLQD